nr:hypothetical protein GCM10025732_55540 [Glycomyces mayteni]
MHVLVFAVERQHGKRQRRGDEPDGVRFVSARVAEHPTGFKMYESEERLDGTLQAVGAPQIQGLQEEEVLRDDLSAVVVAEISAGDPAVVVDELKDGSAVLG